MPLQTLNALQLPSLVTVSALRPSIDWSRCGALGAQERARFFTLYSSLTAAEGTLLQEHRALILTLLLVTAILGFSLGRHYKAAVLVPASFLAFAIALMSADHGTGFAQRLAMLVAIAFALQASYLAGAATRNLEWRSRSRNAQQSLGTRRA